MPPGRAQGNSLILLLLIAIVFGVGLSLVDNAQAQSPHAEKFRGTWHLVKSESSPIDPWNTLIIKLQARPTFLHLSRHWQGPTDYTAVDSLHIPIDGAFHRAPLSTWPDNRHIGAFLMPNRPRYVSAKWLNDGQTLQVTSHVWIRGSQGARHVRTYTEYRLAPQGDRLIVLELRSTRPRARRYVLTRHSLSHGN